MKTLDLRSRPPAASARCPKSASTREDRRADASTIGCPQMRLSMPIEALVVRSGVAGRADAPRIERASGTDRDARPQAADAAARLDERVSIGRTSCGSSSDRCRHASGGEPLPGGRDDVGEQRLLAAVVPVQGRLGHAHPGRDLRASSRLVALLAEDVERGVEDLAPPALDERREVAGLSVLPWARSRAAPLLPTRCTNASSSVGSTRLAAVDVESPLRREGRRRRPRPASGRRRSRARSVPCM